MTIAAKTTYQVVCGIAQRGRRVGIATNHGHALLVVVVRTSFHQAATQSAFLQARLAAIAKDWRVADACDCCVMLCECVSV